MIKYPPAPKSYVSTTAAITDAASIDQFQCYMLNGNKDCAEKTVTKL